jgi:hypothetical protein
MACLPPGEWMTRLKRNDNIWLTKQETFASVSIPWIPPRPGARLGELVISYFAGIAVWYVDGFGRGFDRSQIIQPCVGHLGVDAQTETIEGQYAQMVEHVSGRLRSLDRAQQHLEARFNELAALVLQLNQGQADLSIRITEVHALIPKVATEPTRERSIEL